ncbi:threonylcarbamoyladenosine tRNA methylthiotransferase MtaB [Pseudooceanicola antarcticus]|uniref:Threonylcarbamoyladenosine tRNA methylthiotransferase MtaB n=1 Tax=Pseudooceanicola antarcticus TaxID=1247613 RepID=A0A285HWW2_9RHOB|nr:tRNA (N(6)-L-threonylcarbamoyladenosine(37)-C(2))-methylthiotransferase MtaB [Pseudooceanicola antarcticus]PJE27373.1 tRNA (N(6)-L-threonylcarbamoyladenosine(37)-C(2))-methylthiotransferase MtaB [Pseudooceanicola antarcticus]SNY40200.1 threonylcarbamoyladenosine tRNA methylthiotransferase MtaB [Pseudooceanicola antarcticus]
MAPQPPKFATLGCRLNAYETEAMKAMAAEAGLGDAVIVNTCAVTAEAVRKARQDIRRLRRENPEARLIVTGCAAQTEPETFSAMSEVDMVIGNSEKMQPETWAKLGPDFIGQTERVQVDDIMSVQETAGHLIDGFGTRSRAYVQVQNGCDHRCTFCIIPYGRGNSRSVPAGVVVDQIKRLVQQGYNEVVLTGVDLTSWGADLPAAPRLGDLVMRILRLTDVPRLRISSIDSIEADEALMQAIATEPRLMPHLHLSLQAGDDMILKRMKRRHLRDDAIRFCEDARKLRPEMTFGADIIAGFPTETEEMFVNSLKLVEDCDLTWLHVFPYSKREGTPAAKIPTQVNGKVIKDRAARLRAAGDAQVARHLAAQQGRDHRVLMESPRMGRTEQFTEVHFSADQPEGQVVPVTIIGQEGGHLIA